MMPALHEARNPKELDAAADGLEMEGIAQRWGWVLLRGIFLFAAGVLTFLFPQGAILVFAFVFAGVAFADGVVSLADGLAQARRRESRWVWLVLRGATGILIGLGFAAMPTIAAVNYALLVLIIFAVWLVLNGLSDMSTALRLRREIKGEWLLAASALLSMILGTTILAVVGFHPNRFLVLSWIIAIYAIAAGLALALQAFRLKRIHGGGTPSSG